MTTDETGIGGKVHWLRTREIQADFRRSSLSAHRADREATEDILTDLYEHLGRPRPHFAWFDGPLSCVLACALLARDAAERPGESRADPRGIPLAGPLVGGFDQGQGHFEPLLGIVLEREVRSDFLRSCAELPHAWLPGHGFWGGRNWCRLRDDAGRYTVKRREIDALQRTSGPWFPYAHWVICSERHEHIHFDAEGRVHDAGGPAIGYRDGTALYAWHGTPVPAEWILAPETTDPSIALTWSNIEQRRAAMEIFGWARVLEGFAPRVVDADPDPQIGTLLECDLPDYGLTRFLRVRCGTGRDFVLAVPARTTTAREANAWTYGLSAGELQLEVRT